MARSRNSKPVLQVPEVTFSLELRPETQEQKEAGKRLFARLIGRAMAVGAAGATAAQEGNAKG
jgi:hypothetical protein